MATRTAARSPRKKAAPSRKEIVLPVDDQSGAADNAEVQATIVELIAPQSELVKVRIEGVTPLIVNRFSEKAKEMMLGKQTAQTRQKRAPKDPEALYQASFYRMADGTAGFPAPAFKAAIIGAARMFDGITMTSLKTSIFVQGEGKEQLVPLLGEPAMREDAVRNATGVADLRFRAEFWPWSCELLVEYFPRFLTPGSLLSLINSAGYGGVGDWRPSAPKSFTGTYGRFRVAGSVAVPA